MAEITESVDVAVPVRVAYDQWTQFEEFPRFMEGVVAVQQIDDSHIRWIVEVGGEQEQWEAEIVEQQSDRLIAWRSTEGLINSGRVEFLPTSEGTRVNVALEYEPEGLKESAGALLGVDGSQVEGDLQRFKELVENREVPTGTWRGEIRSGEVVDDDALR
jgi:uncharacterized membrane protein